MGREVVRTILETDDLSLVAAIDHKSTGADSGVLAGLHTNGILIEADLQHALIRSQPDVMVDFTLPEGLMRNIRCALNLGIYTVVGATGLSAADQDEVEELAINAGVAAFIAPNFAIGTVLMMQFAEKAAAYMPDVEIIEFHHDRKLDSPSGTALLTSQRIGAARREANSAPIPLPLDLIEKVPGARGARGDLTGDVPIHSVRLQGFVAHQEVIFGGPGQVLTLRHDSLDRRSFMPGVLLAVRRVKSLSGLVVGLDKLL
jgi:4-hydroxy-tetrahydrodipicolinate reductase